MTVNTSKTNANVRACRWMCLGLVVLGVSMGSGCSNDVQYNGTSTSGSSSSSSGASMSLAGNGAVGDTCGPADGPALDFTIGASGGCSSVPSGPQFRLYAFSGSTSSLMPGQSWAFDAASMASKGTGTYFPDGIGGNPESATSGIVSIVSLGQGTVDVHYEFVTASGTSFAGDAKLTVCPTMIMCG